MIKLHVYDTSSATPGHCTSHLQKQVAGAGTVGCIFSGYLQTLKKLK
jgi:hypothetical protein